jgi:hypothetical protein
MSVGRTQLDDYREEYPLPIGESPEHEAFIRAIVDVLREGDVEAGQVNDQTFPSTASKEALNRHAREVGLTRRENENDATLRWRVRVESGVKASDGDTDSILDVLRLMFGEAALSKITLASPSDEPVLDVAIPDSALDRTPEEIDETEVQDILDRALPMPDAANVIVEGSFAFAGFEGDGFDEGTFGGDPINEPDPVEFVVT